MTSLTPSSSKLQNTITPSANPPLLPTSTSQHIQSSPSISTSPPVNPPNSSTITLSLTNPEPAVAFANSPQNLNTALSTVDNLLAFEDQYENEFLQHPPRRNLCTDHYKLQQTHHSLDSTNPFPTHFDYYQCRSKSFRH